MASSGSIFLPSLSKLTPYNAGLSLNELKARYDLNEVAKLGSNENPSGLLPGVAEALRDASSSSHLYPDADAGQLRETLSSLLKVPSDHLIFGNGSEDLLSIICRSVIGPGDRVVTLYPSFPLHEDYVQHMGGTIDRVAVKNDLTIDLPALLRALQTPAKMVVFSNPMNPVGTWLNPAQLRQVIASVSPDSLMVLDEAYFEYASDGDYTSALEMLKLRQGNWIVLRTFSKAWGMAGLRLGYGVCSAPELKAGFDLVRTPFNANSMAQIAALTSLAQADEMQTRINRTMIEQEEVAKALRTMGFDPAPSLGNFLFFDAHAPSTQIAEQLLKRGTIVKPWKQQGFDTFIRVSIGTKAENAKFLKDLSAVKKQMAASA